MTDVAVMAATPTPDERAPTGRGGPEPPADDPEPVPPSPARPFLPRSSRSRAL